MVVLLNEAHTAQSCDAFFKTNLDLLTPLTSPALVLSIALIASSPDDVMHDRA